MALYNPNDLKKYKSKTNLKTNSSTLLKNNSNPVLIDNTVKIQNKGTHSKNPSYSA